MTVEEEVKSKLKEKITGSFRRIFDTANQYNVDMKTAAYVVGVRRLAEAAHLRGWIN